MIDLEEYIEFVEKIKKIKKNDYELFIKIKKDLELDKKDA